MADTFAIGGDLTVRRLAFGAMRIRREPGRGVEVLRRAVELGVDLIDTADIYGPETSELLIAEALHPYPDGLVIATKGGIGYNRDDGRELDSRPEYLREACDRSLHRLRLDRIDLYQLHRPDPEVPVEESIGALVELQREGKIRHVGVSNFSAELLERACRVATIVSVQNEYNVADRRSEDVLEACERDGIAFLPWSPLADGIDPVAALAWLLHRSPVICPIPGTSSIEHLEQNMAAASVPAGAEAIGGLDQVWSARASAS